MDTDLLSAIIHLGNQVTHFRDLAQKIGAFSGLVIFGWQLFRVIERNKNPHTPGSAGGNYVGMAIGSLMAATSLWGSTAFSAISDDEFGNLVPASTVLSYYGVPQSDQATAVLGAVFNIVEAFGWFAILAAGMSFVQASSMAASGAPVDGSHIWKGLLRWIGGSACICIGWTTMQIYQTLH